jgi:hypothetical protein
MATGQDRYDSRRSEGDMEYVDATGLWVPVSGTKSTGKVPKIQSDGTVAWETSASGSGAETLIDEQELGASAATFAFSGIAADYRDLRIVVRGRGTTATTFCRPRLQMNGDTGNNYDWQRVYARTTTVVAEGGGTVGGAGVAYIDIGLLPASTAPANQSGAAEVRIFNYRGTAFHKPVVTGASGYAATERYVLFGGGSWRSTSAITSLTLILDAGSYDTGSVASLYGIL